MQLVRWVVEYSCLGLRCSIGLSLWRKLDSRHLQSIPPRLRPRAMAHFPRISGIYLALLLHRLVWAENFTTLEQFFRDIVHVDLVGDNFGLRNHAKHFRRRIREQCVCLEGLEQPGWLLQQWLCVPSGYAQRSICNWHA